MRGGVVVGQTLLLLLLLLLLLVGTVTGWYQYSHSLTQSITLTRQTRQDKRSRSRSSLNQQAADKQAKQASNNGNDVRGLECFELRLGLATPCGFQKGLSELSQYLVYVGTVPDSGTQVFQQCASSIPGGLGVWVLD